MSDGGKVISINGDHIPEPGNPVPSVVKELEIALEEARSGEITAISLVRRHFDNSSSFCVVGYVGGYSMIGAAQMAVSELVKVNSDVED